MAALTEIPVVDPSTGLTAGQYLMQRLREIGLAQDSKGLKAY